MKRPVTIRALKNNVIEDLEQILVPRGGNKILVAFEGYFDESGIADDQPVCVVAGYVGGMNQWKRFYPAWREALAEAGLENQGFHASEFLKLPRRDKPYRDWSEDKAKRFMLRLTGIIGGTGIKGVCVSIDRDAFLKLSVLERRWFTGAYYLTDDNGQTPYPQGLIGTCAPSKPYFLAFIEAFVAVAFHFVPDGEEIYYFFDQQKQYEGLATEIFKRIRDTRPEFAERVGNIGFYSRLQFLPLQAADLLAHCWYKHRRDGDQIDERVGHTIHRLLTRTTRSVHFDEAELQKRLDNVPARGRALLREPG